MEEADKRALPGVLIGIFLAFVTVLVYTTLPTFEFELWIFEVMENGFGMGRLYILGMPIHHYMYGFVMCIVGSLVLLSEKCPLLGGFVTGFGIYLIMDQILMIIGIVPWGA